MSFDQAQVVADVTMVITVAACAVSFCIICWNNGALIRSDVVSVGAAIGAVARKAWSS